MTAAFADEVASRLSHSLDNALRYERERDVSHALQAGLLGAAPVSVEGVEIATVYRPGSATLTLNRISSRAQSARTPRTISSSVYGLETW